MITDFVLNAGENRSIPAPPDGGAFVLGFERTKCTFAGLSASFLIEVDTVP
jgi:hypothetical protein